MLTFNPSMSVRGVTKAMADMPAPILLDKDYVNILIREVREDRLRAVQEETREDIYAHLKEIVEFINNQLRAIAQEEKLVYSRKTKDGDPMESPETRIFAQNNRIKAMNSVVDNYIKLYEMKMDLGIIDRKLGSVDHRVIDVMAALKKIRNGDYSTKLPEIISRGELTGSTTS